MQVYENKMVEGGATCKLLILKSQIYNEKKPSCTPAKKAKAAAGLPHSKISQYFLILILAEKTVSSRCFLFEIWSFAGGTNQSIRTSKMVLLSEDRGRGKECARWFPARHAFPAAWPDGTSTD